MALVIVNITQSQYDQCIARKAQDLITPFTAAENRTAYRAIFGITAFNNGVTPICTAQDKIGLRNGATWERHLAVSMILVSDNGLVRI